MSWLAAFAIPLVLQVAAVPRRIEPEGCSIKVNTDLPKNEPIMLITTHLALPSADSAALQLAKDERVVLVCPGRNNKFSAIDDNSSEVTATCGRNKYKVNKSSYDVKDFGCTKQPTGEILNTNQTCGPKFAQLLEIGYLVEKQWYPMVSVCHSKTRSISLYAKHILRGKHLKGAQKQSPRPNFMVGGDYYLGFSPEAMYKKTVQRKTLENILGSRNLAQQYIDVTYIARGHLAPDADFVLNSYQHLTYFYVNTAPQWQSVNAGNWLSLEKTLRTYASKNSVDLQIITGTYDVLKLSTEDGKPREIFLCPNGIKDYNLPVPKYFWKLVYNEDTQEGIVFVALNNPFIEKVTLNEILCTNICEETGWMPKSNVWRKLANGYLYCCSIDSLRDVISYIPRLNVIGILKSK